MNAIIDLSILACEPEETYRAKADEFLTSHQLADFRRCPLLHFQKRTGLIEDEDRPAYLLGRAAHVRILEGRNRYESEYAVGGPVNPSTGKPYGPNTKAFAQWAESKGKPVLTGEQAELIENLAAGVAMNDRAVDLIVNGVAEGVVRAEYHGLPCQSRIDWTNPYEGIVDLKTADHLDYFESDAWRYGYGYQLAFYRAVLAEALGAVVPVHIIAVEKRPPFRCGLWRLNEDSLAQAQRENEAAMDRLKRCRELGNWPTGYEEVRLLDWM